MLQFLRYKPIWAAFAATLIVGTGSSIAGGAGAYFYTYVLGDMKLMSGVSVIGLIASLVGIKPITETPDISFCYWLNCITGWNCDGTISCQSVMQYISALLSEAWQEDGWFRSIPAYRRTIPLMYSIKRVNGRKQPSLHSHPLSVRSRRGWEEQFQGM